MKISFVLLLSGLLMMGCASKNTSANSEYQTMPEDNGNQPQVDAGAPASAPESEKPVAKSSPSPVAGPNLGQAQANLAEAQKTGNDEAIYRTATSVLVLSPQDVKAQNALGLYHFKRLHFLAAQYFFSRALVSNPKSSEIYNNIGLVRLALKEPREAIKSFRKAIELDPENTAACSNLGNLYVENRDFAKAVVPLEMAVQKNSKDYRNQVNFGIALAGTGKFGPAKEHYETAIKINTSGREAIFNLAILQIDQLKQYQEGLDLLNKVRFLGVPDSVRGRIIALENKAKAGLK